MDNPSKNLDDSEATNEVAKAIQPIHSTTVHKICSGQVVLNLATAVKELVENALDASATIIEVKLRDHGIESIEVCDNGEGVEESNFGGLTAKYHTSKLREFSDLECVETFGFRGEALSSLCALSKMVITTRHCKADYGTRLELDESGAITKKEICARQTGTTVQLTNLFGTLPVRKKEFTRNIKKEFVKMCQILQGYCLVATGVRIICTNQNQNGPRSIVMATNGGRSVMDNISAIFGTKQVFDVLQIVPPTEIDELLIKNILEEFEPSVGSDAINNLSEADLKRFTIDGWISTCHHGSGRSSKDRQFVFINSRPCEPKKIIKIVNEIYHRYNSNQSPFLYLNIEVQRSDVDVNVTPDKRQLMVNNENILLLILKACLLKTFSNLPSTFKMQNLNLSTENAEDQSRIRTTPDPKKFSQMLAQWRKTGQTDQPCSSENKVKRKVSDEVECRNIKMRKIHEYLTQQHDETVPMSDDETLSSSIDQSSCLSESIDLKSPENTSDAERKHDVKEDIKKEKSSPLRIIDTYNGASSAPKANVNSIKYKITKVVSARSLSCEKNSPSKSVIKPSEKDLFESDEESRKIDSNSQREDEDEDEEEENDDAEEDEDEKESEEEVQYDSENDSPVEDDQEQYGFKSQCTINMLNRVTTSIEEISELMAAEEKFVEQSRRNKLERLKFKATIEPSKNKLAEEELQTEISKKSFAQMEIIGQFNLGFIVVKLEDDLFIVDQHATDEKFNYETLQKETTLFNQKLVVPQPLELTAVSEMVLIDNLEVFERNGFKFQINESAQPTKKIQLIGKPMSNRWEFGKEDIDELIFLLQESPNTVLRPSKISAMLASRACRKSVMIGMSLSTSDMQRLINQMGQIEHPWNCPHGRPTMRHLVNLAMISN
ncbi:Mismatch repair endonuclease PMS2 [Pseudolycoriella hygida]|uniref:Mismatch repair endonuclease PMS2 n=1 Tax=Pseudolycoriella hygida TaxID=35572 RepID=A0A9Q0S7E6_9DIPT|nr:Mismatch repair endonuclease PMS2 [Pseudolycoriella hygida]